MKSYCYCPLCTEYRAVAQTIPSAHAGQERVSLECGHETGRPTRPTKFGTPTEGAGYTNLMTTYSAQRTVTLSLSEWLELDCAMGDAIAHNEEEFPHITASLRDLKNRIQEQVGADLDAAAKQLQAAQAH